MGETRARKGPSREFLLAWRWGTKPSWGRREVDKDESTTTSLRPSVLHTADTAVEPCVVDRVGERAWNRCLVACKIFRSHSVTMDRSTNPKKSSPVPSLNISQSSIHDKKETCKHAYRRQVVRGDGGSARSTRH